MEVVRSFGVEHGRCRGQGGVGGVVVADHHPHAQGVGLGNFAVGFDAAVQGHQQAAAGGSRGLNPHRAQAVAFADSVGNVGVHLPTVVLQKVGYQRHRRGSVHVVVAVNRHLLARFAGSQHLGYGQGHVCQGPGLKFRLQDGSVQIQRGVGGADVFQGLQPAGPKNPRQGRLSAQGVGQSLNFGPHGCGPNPAFGHFG